MKAYWISWIVVIILVVMNQETQAQFINDSVQVHARWIHRIPELGTFSNGSGSFVIDSYRGRILYSSGPENCFWSSDMGETWTPFGVHSWSLHTGLEIQIQSNGVYIAKLTNAHNYVRFYRSEDGGDTWEQISFAYGRVKELGLDTLMTKNTTYTTLGVYFVLTLNNLDGRFIAISKDAGRSFGLVHVDSALGVFVDFTSPRYNAIDDTTLQLLDLTTPSEQYEVHLPSATIHRRTHNNYYRYHRFDDGSMIATTRAGREVLIRRADGSQTPWMSITSLVNDSARVSILHLSRHDDTTAIIITDYGHVLRYTAGDDTLSVLHANLSRRHNERTRNLGVYGDLVALGMFDELARPDLRQYYAIVNIRTGQTTSWHQNGDHDVLRDTDRGILLSIPNYRILPLSSTGLLTTQGLTDPDMLITRDGGKQWQHVMSIEQSRRILYEHLDVDAVFPLRDGRLAARVAGRRIIVQQQIGDTVWPVVIHEPIQWTSPTQVANIIEGSPQISMDENEDIIVAGDVVVRWNLRGEFVDTVFRRRAKSYSYLPHSRVKTMAADTLWYSFDEGKEWTAVNLGIPTGPAGVRAFVSSVIDLPDGTMLAGLRGIWHQVGIEEYADSIIGGVWRSTDKGDTWERWDNGMKFDTYIMNLWRNPLTGTLFASASQVVNENQYSNTISGAAFYTQRSWKLYRSTDEGVTWTPSFVWGGLGDDFVTESAMAQDETGGLHVAVPRMHYLQSRDDGQTWVVPYTMNIDTARIISMARSYDDRTLYFGTSKGLCALDNTMMSSAHQPDVIPTLSYTTTSNGVQLELPWEGSWCIDVYDVSGRTVSERSCSDERVRELDLPGNGPRTFVLRVSNDTTSIVRVLQR